VTVFLGAILLFISLFNQTIQTAILYQRHRYLATKCSDLLDNILLNPGCSNVAPTTFGLQDPEFTEYRLSTFSLMRLNYSVGEPVTYPMTGLSYSNITVGSGGFLLVPFAETIDYSTASRLLGINGTYGFNLTLTPVLTVAVSEMQSYQPNTLTLAVDVMGYGQPLSNATLNYCFINVTKIQGDNPVYTIENGATNADKTGRALLNFSGVDGTNETYALVVYAHLCGLAGVGYYEHMNSAGNYVIPFVYSFAEAEAKVILAHSYDVYGGDDRAIRYNATFLLLTEHYNLNEMPLEGNSTGTLNSGQDPQHAYKEIEIGNNTGPGILVVTYTNGGSETGVVLMPWGISSLAFPVIFGSYNDLNEWVATDMRQVIVNAISYQATLALWNLEGY
jgi:hypothetical protein